MIQRYFIYNNVKYPTGTEIIMRPLHRNSKCTQCEKAYFICFDEANDTFVYRCDGKQYFLHSNNFWRRFEGVTGTVNNNIQVPEMTRIKDFQITNLFFGWVWYIFIMIVLVLFKNAIFGWILISIIFFSWRHDVLKKEGYYVKW